MPLQKSNGVKKKKAEETQNEPSGINMTDNNWAQPTGIMFNYNIKIRTAIDNKSSEQKNRKLLEVDDKNLVPNKMYKIVVECGKIMLAEHYANDLIDESDSDVEFIENDDCNDVPKNTVINNNRILNINVSDTPRTYPQSGPVLPIFMPINNHDYCATPRQQVREQPQCDKTPQHIKTQNAESNENLMKGLATINGPKQSDNQMFTTQRGIADARKGKAMVLLPLAKYKALKKKLTDLQESYKTKCDEILKLKEEMLKNKEEMRKDKEEMRKDQESLEMTRIEEMQTLEQKVLDMEKTKKKLERIFTEAQMQQMTKSVKEKNIVWTDEEMEKVVFLRQLTSVKAYLFLKYKMHFPLPPQPVVTAWMAQRNMLTRGKGNPSKSGTKTKKKVPIQDISQSEEGDTLTRPAQNVDSEITLAINSIRDGQMLEQTDMQHLSHSAEYGEEFIVYADENNIQEAEETLIIPDYIEDNSVARTEEIIAMASVKRKRSKPVMDVIPRCMLCTRPFDSDYELTEHVNTHYPNSMYTTYLEARSPYTCEFCNAVTPNRIQLAQHHRVHLGVDHLKCWFPGCDYVGKNTMNLKSHLDMHRPASFRCEQCGKMFKTPKYLRQHIERGHSAKAALRCPLCHRACLTEFTFRHHMRSHARPPRIKCRSAGCEELFYSSTLMRQHFAAAHPRTYTCHRCPATFRHDHDLKRHLNRHESQRLSTCVRCVKVFHDYGEYYAHRLTHAQAKRPAHTCVCGDTFKLKRQLIAHKRECEHESNKSARNKKRKTAENVTDKDKTGNEDREPNIVLKDGKIIKVPGDEVKTVNAHNTSTPKVLKLTKVTSLPPHLSNKIIPLPTTNQLKVITFPTNSQEVDEQCEVDSRSIESVNDDEIEEKTFKPNIVIQDGKVIKLIDNNATKVINEPDRPPGDATLLNVAETHSPDTPKLNLTRVISLSLPPHIRDKVISTNQQSYKQELDLQGTVIDENNETITYQKRKSIEIANDDEIEEKKFKPNIIIQKQEIMKVVDNNTIKVITVPNTPSSELTPKTPKLLKLKKLTSVTPEKKFRPPNDVTPDVSNLLKLRQGTSPSHKKFRPISMKTVTNEKGKVGPQPDMPLLTEQEQNDLNEMLS